MPYDTRVKQQLNKNPNAYTIVGSHTRNASLGSVVTLSLPSGANGILIQASAQNVKYTLDGTNPTSTIGFTLSTSAAPVLITFPADTTVLKVIEATAGAAIDYQAVRIQG